MAGRLGDLGGRLREERSRHGISQRELARRLGLSGSLISQIESGQSKPSVQTLYAIVTELDISLDDVFQGVGADGRPGDSTGPVPPGPEQAMAGPVVHPDGRQIIELASGVRWERLTNEHEPRVDFLHVVYDVEGTSAPEDRLMRHEGREYGYVISGLLGLRLGFQTYELGPGDSIAFDSTVPHRLWNRGREPVHGIWFVTGRQA